MFDVDISSVQAADTAQGASSASAAQPARSALFLKATHRELRITFSFNLC